jgi:polysaccharide deacetylase 2 family uncharacterized protein YibQ
MHKTITFFVILLVFFAVQANASISLWLKDKKLAIVIDDMGYDKKLAKKFALLHLPLTYSFLPDAEYSMELSDDFGIRGYTVMIHMPSEPINYPKENPGKYAIYVRMTKQQTYEVLKRAYRKVHHAMGLNNHMGSRILKDKEHLDYIMEFLKERHLFFIDSVTIDNTIGCQEAEKFGILCARRDVFIDNKKDVLYIKHQIQVAINMLKKIDSVVAIGHCNEETYEAIRQMKSKLKPYLVSVEYVVH